MAIVCHGIKRRQYFGHGIIGHDGIVFMSAQSYAQVCGC